MAKGRPLVLVAVALLATGCAKDAEKAVSPPAVKAVTPVPLVNVTAAQMAQCRRSRLLRPICPTRVPRVVGEYRAFAARDGEGTRYAPLHIFDLERVGRRPPSDGQWSRPPYGVHITVATGQVERLTPFEDPTAATPRRQPTNRLVQQPEPDPVSFGPRTWNETRGLLYLAPTFPSGGQVGGHLVFQWTHSGRLNIVSLHSWTPIERAIATLESVVRSIPR